MTPLNTVGFKEGEIISSNKKYLIEECLFVCSRQVWMYATLYTNVERFKLDTLYQSAIRGGDFLMRNVKCQTTGKCYFSVTREGAPIKIQRTIYSEVQMLPYL